MTLKALEFDVGPDGSAATGGSSGNSGANSIALGSGGSATYVGGALAIFGSFSLQLTSGTTNCQVRELIDPASAGNTVSTTNNVMSFGLTVTMPSAAPTANESFWTPRSATAVASSVYYATDNAVKFKDSAGANATVLITSAQVAALSGRRVRYTLLGNVSAGTYQLKAYPIGSTTAINTISAGSAWSWGGSPFAGHDAGVITSGTARTYILDHMALNDGSTTEIGEPAASAAPTVNAGVDQYIDAGATIALAATVTDATSTTWTCTASPVGAPTPSFSAAGSVNTNAGPAYAGVYTFQESATGPGGGPITDTIDIYVAAAAGDPVTARSTTGVATNDGGAASKIAAITDTSDTTQLLLTATQVETVTYNPMRVGPISIFSKLVEIGGNMQVKASVYASDGTTLAYEHTYDLTTTAATIEIVVDSAGLAILSTRATNRAIQVKYTAIAA